MSQITLKSSAMIGRKENHRNLLEGSLASNKRFSTREKNLVLLGRERLVIFEEMSVGRHSFLVLRLGV
jgi:hypothetical protein